MKRKWTYDGVMRIWEDDSTRPDNRILVLELGPGLGFDTNTVGNLAAAAPQLLEALEQLIPEYKLLAQDQDYEGNRWNPEFDDEYLAAIAAIKQAKGE